MERVLIVQTSFLGDVVLSTPVIKKVAEIHPGAEVWIMTTPLASSIVKNDPLIAGVIEYDKNLKDSGMLGLIRKSAALKRLGFSVVYSLHRSYRTAILLFLAGIKKRVGFKEAKLSVLYTDLKERDKSAPHDVLRNLSLVNEPSSIDASSQELRVFNADPDPALEIKRAFGLERGRYAVLAPGSVWETKRWLPDRFGQVGRGILELNLKVVLVGSKSDVASADVAAREGSFVNLCGKTDISQMMSLVKDSGLVISNDSFPLHLASAFKVPTVAIFCSTVPEFGFGPWKNESVVLGVDGLPCRPCGRHGRRSCPTGTEACMRGISVEMVMSASRKLLQVNRHEA